MLGVLPVIALVAATVGLLAHPVGTVGAVLAIGAVVVTILLRVALVMRAWQWPADRAFVVAVGLLALVMVAGAALGQRG